jgi:hypothetical protein
MLDHSEREIEIQEQTILVQQLLPSDKDTVKEKESLRHSSNLDIDGEKEENQGSSDKDMDKPIRMLDHSERKTEIQASSDKNTGEQSDREIISPAALQLPSSNEEIGIISPAALQLPSSNEVPSDKDTVEEKESLLKIPEALKLPSSNKDIGGQKEYGMNSFSGEHDFFNAARTKQMTDTQERGDVETS